MKKIAIPAAAVAFSLLLTGLVPAGTVNIPKDEPVISVSIPDSWKPEETDKGITCESPDQVAAVIFEVTSTKGANALVDENIDWLVKDQGVQIDPPRSGTGSGSISPVRRKKIPGSSSISHPAGEILTTLRWSSHRST